MLNLGAPINRKTAEFSDIHAHLRHLWLKIRIQDSTKYLKPFNHRLHRYSRMGAYEKEI